MGRDGGLSNVMGSAQNRGREGIRGVMGTVTALAHGLASLCGQARGDDSCCGQAVSCRRKGGRLDA